jgi:hypothetical protein
MLLAQLTEAEREYLCGPQPVFEEWPAMLAQRLGALLGARIRQRVQIHVQASSEMAYMHDSPQVYWDAALDAMWLCGRLGGRTSVAGAASPALSKSLKRTLELALAEAWLSMQGIAALPAALSFRIETTGGSAELGIRFPEELKCMNQWARKTIHHAE